MVVKILRSVSRRDNFIINDIYVHRIEELYSVIYFYDTF